MIIKSLLYHSTKKNFHQIPSLFATLGFSYYYLKKQRSECIGIFGCVSEDDKASQTCFEGLQAVSTKGYDSCGLGTISNENFNLVKFANEERFGGDCIQRLQLAMKSMPQSNIAIAHTRWATHGEKVDLNAHPHTDLKKRIQLVHNGIIENYQVLKEDLLTTYQIAPQSETDSEIIALLIGVYLDDGKSIIEAIKQALQRLIGSYNIALLYLAEPAAIYLAKNSGQMAIGYNKVKKQYLVSSEVEVLREYFDVENITLTKDNEIVRVEPNSISTTFIGKSEAKVQVKLKPGIQHYFIQEMQEQPEAVAKCLNYGARLAGGQKGMVKLGGLDANEDALVKIENLLIGACGTSYYASLYGQQLMREFGCFKSVEVKIASEITEEDFPLSNGGLLSVSQSGETTDLLNPFKEAGERGLVRFNIVNNVESTLAREAKCGIFLNAGKEISIASTKAFICQVVAFSLLTLWFSQKVNYKPSKEIRERLWTDLKLLEDKVKQVVSECPPFSKAVGQILKNEKHVFLLGLGLAECIAKEGSLKLKELTYKHCQSYSLTDSSNGYFNYAKQNTGTPTFFIILNDEHKEKSFNFLEYITQKLKAQVFVLSDIDDSNERQRIMSLTQHAFWVPHNGYLSALLCIIPIQLAAFETTLALGRDPDKPRNLTKVVL